MSQRDVKWLFLRQQEVHINTNSGRNSEPDKSILEVLLIWSSEMLYFCKVF